MSEKQAAVQTHLTAGGCWVNQCISLLPPWPVLRDGLLGTIRDVCQDCQQRGREAEPACEEG